jgi:aspartate beta-hydroxylase
VIKDEAGLDELLQREPRNIAALIAKGDLRTEAGDGSTGAAFYRIALKLAAEAGRLPMPLKPGLERAHRRLREMTERSHFQLEQHLAASGFPPGRRPPRFEESLQILLGRREASLELQQPTTYYYPGLPQRRYYERADLPWAAALEERTLQIREELLGLLAGGEDPFAPYLVSDPTRPPRDFHGLVDNPEWGALYLWDKGGPVADLASRCPRTLALLLELDLCRITSRAPAILFSRLRPGARIPPHTGMLNARLICHLPLIVPPGCGFRVGGETREWREGELLVFDDSIEHEAWNNSGEDRVILIFDIWRPELEPEERRAIAALFEAMDALNAR